MNLPADLASDVVHELAADPRVFALTVLPGASRRPTGDTVSCDVAREGAHDVLSTLRRLGVQDRGALAIETVDTAPSRIATAAELAAPGAPDDGVVWPLVEQIARDGVRPSFAFFGFLCLATQLAAIAVITDSAVLVVGAMVVAPDFAPVAGMMIATVLRRRALFWDSLVLGVIGFGLAIATVVCTALAARWLGWYDVTTLLAPRPQTSFIWHPDKWSFIVACLAGMAGVLSLTSGRSSVLVGVFISVTTVPAAGNLGLGLAFQETSEILGSAQQLGLNVAGLMVAGVETLLVQRIAWKLVGRRVRDRRHAQIRRRADILG